MSPHNNLIHQPDDVTSRVTDDSTCSPFEIAAIASEKVLPFSPALTLPVEVETSSFVVIEDFDKVESTQEVNTSQLVISNGMVTVETESGSNDINEDVTSKQFISQLVIGFYNVICSKENMMLLFAVYG